MFLLVDIIEMIRVAPYEVGGSEYLSFWMSSAISDYIRKNARTWGMWLWNWELW